MPSTEYLLSVLLVFVRVSGLLVAAPFFSHRFMPVRVRVLLGVLLAYVLVGFARGPLPTHLVEPLGFITAITIEALTGVLLGFAAQFVFYAVQYAGELIGFQMSLSMASVYNPATGAQENPMGMLLGQLFLLLFVLIGGPHQLITALVGSFEVVPLGGAHLTMGGPLLLSWTGEFFSTALRLAAPFMVTLFLVDLALGVYARVVPQADLFSLSVSVKLLLGFVVMLLYVQAFVPVAPDLLADLLRDLEALVDVLRP